nr:zinc metalloprotease [Flavobacteriales bacterium]
MRSFRTQFTLATGALATLALAPNTALAQRVCGSMAYLQQQIAADPGRAARLQQADAHAATFQADQQERSVIVIPVVVHVVWNTSAENVSDARITAQLAQLNADFARMNSDADETPAAFTGLAANTEIQFCLAQQDPNGNATTGIQRRQTSVSSFSTNDNVKRYNNGGLDAWPRDRYLNLWCCDLGSGLLGYAQFPGGQASTDGVVVDYSTVGSMTVPGTGGSFKYGRSATHEVGHWMNLRHIWGDDGSGCNGSDQVADTPNQANENYGCPNFPQVSCSNGPNGDMFMNYMDYSDDLCMNLFTNGQADRMQSVFSPGGSRQAITTSVGCMPPNGGSCNAPTNPSANVTGANSA